MTSPGRLEVVSRQPLVLLDGAHNPAGARALAEALLTEFVVDRRTLVVACLADKDVRGILEGLAPATGRLIVTTNRSPRAAPAERLRKEAEALGLVAEVAPDVATAVRGRDRRRRRVRGGGGHRVAVHGGGGARPAHGHRPGLSRIPQPCPFVRGLSPSAT